MTFDVSDFEIELQGELEPAQVLSRTHSSLPACSQSIHQFLAHFFSPDSVLILSHDALIEISQAIT